MVWMKLGEQLSDVAPSWYLVVQCGLYLIGVALNWREAVLRFVRLSSVAVRPSLGRVRFSLKMWGCPR